MTPSPIQKLKPYFKPRPKAGSQRAAAAQAPAPAPAPPAAQGQPPAPAQPAAVAQPAPPGAGGVPADAAELRGRREQLARRYAELQSDLGGLVYEMAIRDHFRLDVVVRRAAELQGVDAELSAVEQRLGLGSPGPVPACPSCGAPVQLGARFCGRCGSTLAQPASPAAGAPQPGVVAPPQQTVAQAANAVNGPVTPPPAPTQTGQAKP